VPIRIFVNPPRLTGVLPTPSIRRRSLELTAGANITLTPTQTDGLITVAIASTGGSSGPAEEIRESSGPTTLTVGAIGDGQILKRVGSTVVGAWALAFALTFDGNTYETGPAPVEYSAGTSWA
jgi:hypothetical protein